MTTARVTIRACWREGDHAAPGPRAISYQQGISRRGPTSRAGAVTRLIDRYRRARASVGSRGGSTPRLIEITSAALRACARFYEPIAREDAALLEERTEKELEVILEYLRISYELTKRHTERGRGHARPCPAAEASRE